MNNAILQGVEIFSHGDINTVYENCYFKLTEATTSIIYEAPMNRFMIRMSVDKEDDTSMLIEDVRSGEMTALSTVDEELVCDDEIINTELCSDIVRRYLQLMDAFVHFADAEG